MKGKIVITCDEHGTHIRTDMEALEKHDYVFLVHALGKSLGLGPDDFIVIALADAEGVLDSVSSPTKVTIDTDELLKQLKEEQLES